MNFGPGTAAGFQNALATGLQLGQVARQNQERREYRNALAQFDPTNPETVKPIMAADPRLGMQLQGQMQAQQAAQAEAALTTRALQGDEAALNELATVNFDRWRQVDDRTKAQAAEEARLYGQAALDVLNRPQQERAQIIMGYAQQFGSEEIARIAQMPPQEQEAALRAAVAEADLIEKLQALEKPQQFNIGPGEGRYEMDPRTRQVRTVVQPNLGGAPAFSPVQQQPRSQSPAGEPITYDQYRAILNDAGQGPADAFLRDSGRPVQVQTREQVDMLPSGTIFITPDGRRKVKP